MDPEEAQRPSFALPIRLAPPFRRPSVGFGPIEPWSTLGRPRNGPGLPSIVEDEEATSTDTGLHGDDQPQASRDATHESETIRNSETTQDSETIDQPTLQSDSDTSETIRAENSRAPSPTPSDILRAKKKKKRAKRRKRNKKRGSDDFAPSDEWEILTAEGRKVAIMLRSSPGRYEADPLPTTEIFINHNAGVLARLYRDTIGHFITYYKLSLHGTHDPDPSVTWPCSA